MKFTINYHTTDYNLKHQKAHVTQLGMYEKQYHPFHVLLLKVVF